MVALEELREQALQELAGHYAAGELRLGTLEHRVKEALAAESPDEMSGATWDLPAILRCCSTPRSRAVAP